MKHAVVLMWVPIGDDVGTAESEASSAVSIWVSIHHLLSLALGRWIYTEDLDPPVARPLGCQLHFIQQSGIQVTHVLTRTLRAAASFSTYLICCPERCDVSVALSK